MAGIQIPAWLKWGFLSVLVLIAVGDSLLDSFNETDCTKDGILVPSGSVSGTVTCQSVTGIRFSWTNYVLYSWKVTYEGEMAFGRMNGRGEYRTAHGARYHGYFLEDQREGQGSFYSKDSSTSWSGTWENDELTGPVNVLRTKRPDIFNKLGSGPFPPIVEAVYTGFTVNGLVSGSGKIEFYSEEPNRRLIFAVEATFAEGAMNQPVGEVLFSWGADLPTSIKSSQVVLKDWKSQWSYGNQRVSGFIVFMEQDLAFSFSDGLTQRVNASDLKQPLYIDSNLSHEKASELEAIKLVIEAVRAFEWHFLFNRLQLGPLPSITVSDADSKNFEGHIEHSHDEKLEL